MRVTTYRSMAEVRRLRGAWGSLQVHPWSAHDYFVERVARREGFRRAHVVALERDGEIACLLAARMSEESVPWRVGGRVVARGRARVLRTSTGALMGSPSRDEARAIVRSLLEALSTGEADAVYLHQLDEESPLAQEARRLPSLLARDHFTRRVVHWTFDLPDSFEAYLDSRSRNTRKHLRRGARRIERALPDLRFVCYRDPSDLERLVRDCERVARTTYQRRIGVGFVDDAGTRENLAWLLRAGWLRAHLLYDGERPIAFAQDVRFGSCLHMGATGYDPALASLGPGTHLLARIIESACESGVQRIDLGPMDADYKRSFASRCSHLVSVYIFAGSPSGLLMALTRGLTGATDRLARGLLGDGRARRWARRLVQPASPRER